MKKIIFPSLAFIALLSGSCSKFDGEKRTKMSIEGIVRDQYNGNPVAGVDISVQAIKSGSGGWGFNFDSKSEMVGSTTTNGSGYYKINMKVFESANRLNIEVNYGLNKSGYSGFQSSPDLSSFNRRGSNMKDYLLGPTATLKIKFKNASPVAATDTFSFGWYNRYSDRTKSVLSTSSCGTVLGKNNGYWIGQDACGEYNIDVMAEQKCYVYWNVRKSGNQQNYRDSFLVARNSTTVYNINY